MVNEFLDALSLYEKDRASLLKVIKTWSGKYCKPLPKKNAEQHKARKAFEPVAEKLRGLVKQVDLLYKLVVRAVEFAEKDLEAKRFEKWDARSVGRLKKDIDALRKEAVEQLKLAVYFHRRVLWLHSRFPKAKLAEVEGLVKLVDISEIKENDCSLTPGRYVGVAPPEEDEDFDFEEAMREIHAELAGLNEEAVELAGVIQKNLEGLGG